MRRNRRILEIVMLVALCTALTGCAKFSMVPKEETGVPGPSVSVPEESGVPELSESVSEDAGAEYTSELPVNSAQGDLPDASAEKPEEAMLIDPAGMTLET